MKKIFTLLILMFFVNILYAQTWKWSNPLPTGNITQRIFFTDASTVYITGDAGTIIKTTDGGTHWTCLNSGTNAWLSGIYFLDADNGYVVGEGGTVLKTTDGGITWTSMQVSSYSYDGVQFPSQNIGYLIGNSSYGFNTTIRKIPIKKKTALLRQPLF